MIPAASRTSPCVVRRDDSNMPLSQVPAASAAQPGARYKAQARPRKSGATHRGASESPSLSRVSVESVFDFRSMAGLPLRVVSHVSSVHHSYLSEIAREKTRSCVANCQETGTYLASML